MKKISGIFGVFTSVAILAGSVYGITHAQEIMDWWRLRGYEPPARIVQLADKTTMKPGSRRVFFVERPSLDDKSSFRTHCPEYEQSIVLGCYVSRNGIYLLDVSDPRLNGVVEVTAAHEFLHAEYERLSTKERENVDKLTSSFFSQLKDQRIKDTIERYRAKDVGVVPNELHSILGTEVRSLSPELEAYYGQYFSDRKQIVSFSEKYEKTFVDLENQVKAYDERLAKLKGQVEANQTALETQSQAIDAKRGELDSLLQTEQTEAYNAAVPGFNAQVNSYNRLVNTTKSLIEQYNSLVEERNNIATTEQELIHAIDSKVETKKTQ